MVCFKRNDEAKTISIEEKKNNKNTTRLQNGLSEANKVV